MGSVIPGNSASPDSSDVATFGALTAAETITVDATRYIGGITFQNTAGSGINYTLSGGSLFLNNGGTIQLASTAGAHTETISSPITIDGSSATVTSSGAGNTSVLNISGTITAASGNTTTLTLNGTRGALPGNASQISGTISDPSGGTLALVMSGTAWYINSQSSTYSGGTAVSAGTLDLNGTGTSSQTPLGSGLVTISGGTILLGNSTPRSVTLGGLAGSGKLQATSVGSSLLTLNVAAGPYIYSGGLGGTTAASAANALALTKSGNGTQNLAGNNPFNGAVTVSAGTLQLGNANALGFGGYPLAAGTATAGTTVSSGGTLDLNGQTIDEPITISGTGVGGNGALVNNSGSAATIDNGIAGTTLASSGSGSGFSSVPTVAISGSGSGATATALLGVTTASFAITSGGSYTTKPTGVTIAGGVGAAASLTFSASSPYSITAITVTAPGSGFTAAPTVTFTGSPVGTAAVITGNANNFCVGGLTTTAAGSGYTGSPSYTFNGAAATVTPNLSSVTLAAASSIGGSGNITINAVISGAFPLTKVGAGTLTLTGINTYSGTTTVSGGTLTVSSAQNGGGAFLVNDGTTLNVTRDSTTTALATSGLTLGSSTGATLGFSLPSGNPAAQVITAGSLTLNGTTTVVISGNSFSIGQFHLIQYAGPISGSGSFNSAATMPAGYQASIVNTGNGYIDLNITSVPITWEGYTSANWNTSDLNWTNGSTAAAYVDGDGVTLDDTAAVSSQTNLNLVGTLQPASVIVNNSVLAYELSGSGAIAGNTALTKLGTGGLTIANANTFSGGTTISAGTVQLGDGSSANGSVGSGNITNNAALIVANPSAQTVANAISGTGSLTKLASGTAILTGVNTYSGSTTVNAGELDLNTTGGTAIGGNLTVSGGTVKLLQGAQINSAKSLAVSSGTFDAQSFNQTLGGVQITGGNLNGTGGGILSSTTAYDLQAGSVGAILSGTAAINKTTTGTVTLTGANTVTNAVTISAGAITVNNGGALNANGTAGGGQVIVANLANTLATLNISGGNVNATKGGAPSLSAGTASGAAGVINLTSGTLSLTSDAWIGAGAGINGFGALNMTGGTANFGSYLALGRSSAANGQSRGELIMSGGNLTVNANALEIGSFQNNQMNTSVATLSGNANLTIASTATYLSVSSSQNGILNLLPGSEQVNINSSSGLALARNATSETGIVNLNGGTITTPLVFKGTGSGAAGYFNFNGGTLKANVNKTTFMTGLTGAYVYGGGAVIDDGGFAITIGQPLLSPTVGNGVVTNGLAVSGSGFLVPPIVDVLPDPSDTTGAGASAIATIDGNGNLTGVIMTSPGVGYTGSPSFMFTGGGGSATVTAATGSTAANTGGGLTKNGSGTLTLSGVNTYTGPTIINAGTLLIGSAGQLASGSYAANITDNGTLNYGSSAAQSLGGVVSGTGALSISGTGTLTLSGANSYAGTTTIGAGKLLADVADVAGTGALGNGANITFTGGTLQFDANSAGSDWSARFKNSTSSIALNDGGQNMSLANVIDSSNTGGLTKSGAGIMTISGANTYTGTTVVNGGTLQNGSANTFTGASTNLTVSGTGVFDLNGYNAQFSSINAGANTGVITNSSATMATLTMTNQSATVVNTLIQGNLAVQWAGGNAASAVLNQANDNTFTGGLTLTYAGAANGNRIDVTGSPIAANIHPFGTGPITLGLSSGDKVQLLLAPTAGGSFITNAFVVNSSLGTDNTNVFRIDCTNTFPGQITANTNVTFGTGSTARGLITWSGQITGVGGVIDNNTTLILSNVTANVNDYQGDTVANNSGSLILGAADQIPNGTGKGNLVLSANTAAFNLNGFSDTINGLSGSGIITNGMAGTQTLTVGDNKATSVFSGSIKIGTGDVALTKIGNGTLTLSGTNTYTGNTTINAGELIGQTGASCSNSAFTVAAGATNGASVAAANGRWSCNALTYNSGTTYADFNFNSFAPSTNVAPLNVGTLTANGTTAVSLRNVTIPALLGTYYPLIHYTGTDPSAGNFSLIGAQSFVTNARCGVVVDSANKNVSFGVLLMAPNLKLTNAPGVARIITATDLVAAGLASVQGSPNYTFTVGTSTNGGSVSTNGAGTMIQYTNSTSAVFGDSFTYTVNDGVSSATATVTINFASAAGPSLSAGTDGNNHAVINFNALPGYTYHMQHATILSPANWTNLLNTITVPSNGQVNWTNFESAPDGFYRLVYP